MQRRTNASIAGLSSTPVSSLAISEILLCLLWKMEDKLRKEGKIGYPSGGGRRKNSNCDSSNGYTGGGGRKKKKRSPTVSHLGPVETQSLSTMGQVLERIELKLLGSWCNWTTSPPTTRLQHPESSLRFGRVTTDDQHTAPGNL